MNMIWSPGTTLAEVEKQVILIAFKFYREVKTSTASALGISVRTLDAKLELYEQEEKGNEERRKIHESKRADERRKSLGQPGLPVESQTVSSNGPRIEGNRIIPAVARPKANAGNGVESGSGSTAERTVPVREREKVQEVLSPKVAAGGSRGRG